MKSFYFAAVSFALLALSAGDASACDCAGTRPPCQAYGEASAVFLGTVIESRVFKVTASSMPLNTTFALAQV